MSVAGGPLGGGGDAAAVSAAGAGGLTPQIAAQLAQVEDLARKQFTSMDAAERTAAKQMLAGFETNAECIATARLILDYSREPFALLLAGKSLQTLLTLFFHTFTGQETLQIRDYLLNYVANACTNPAIPAYVINPLLATIARITKLGWRQEPNAPAGQIGSHTTPAIGAPGGASGLTAGGHSSIVETCGTFFQHSLAHHNVGLRLLSEIVSEMEKPSSVESPSDHRKTSRAFRDHALLPILQIALRELRTAAATPLAGNPEQKQLEDLLTNALHLMSSAFSFDFLGSVLDETQGEDSNVTLQVPSTWRVIVEDNSPDSPVALLTRMFTGGTYSEEIQSSVLIVFTCLASVRRSLFSNEESRMRFMSFLMSIQMAICTKFSNAAEGEIENVVYHESCRFLARFKYNFTLNDLVRSPSFEPWLKALYDFTGKTGHNWEESANSVSYLLGVWSRIAADVPQLRIAESSSSSHTSSPVRGGVGVGADGTVTLTAVQKVQALILELVPVICTTFINTRLEMVARAVASTASSTPLDNAGTWTEAMADVFAEPNLSDQLKYVATLGRFHLAATKNFLKQKMGPLVEEYKTILQAVLAGGHSVGGPVIVRFAVAEAQLSMMFYIIGAIIGSSSSMPTAHPSTSFAGLYTFPNGEKVNYKDHLEFLDAELISMLLLTLPAVDARIEKGNINAAVAKQGHMAVKQLEASSPLFQMRASQKHLALSVLSFFNQFRVKYLNTLQFSNYNSYDPINRRAGMYSVYPAVHDSMGSDSASAADKDNANAPPGIPEVDTIAHGPAANIFSRTAFFCKQPLTPLQMLNLLVNQFLTFLNFCSYDEDVVSETLNVFDALSLNYATSQQLANLEPVKVFLQANNSSVGLGSTVTSTSSHSGAPETKMMSPHTSSLLISDLQFLQSTHHPKLQTLFYQILSRLVFKGSNLDFFPSFIQPFTLQLSQLASMQNPRLMPKSAVEQVVLLVHKLHGIISSVLSKVVFQMFYKWFFVDNAFHVLIVRLVESFWDMPRVLNPILSFYAELIHNKSMRIQFDSNSPAGVILFKETCKIVQTYVNRITLVQRGSGANDGSGAAAGEQSAEAAKQSTIASNELYEAKLKGMSRVLQLVSHSLSGGYANFGVMALYNDASLKLCIKGVLQLVMSVRFSEIINFPKVATNYFTLLEILFKSHVELVTELCDAAKFLALVSSLHEGLLSVQTVQQQHAALAIEHLVKWHYQQRNAKPGSVEAVARARLDQYIAQSSTLLPEILCTLFNLYLFDPVEQHWSLGRPILGMLVLQPDSLAFYQHRLLHSQTLPPAQQGELAVKIQAACQTLMQGIANNLEPNNRDLFQQHLTEFRNVITTFCTRPI